MRIAACLLLSVAASAAPSRSAFTPLRSSFGTTLPNVVRVAWLRAEAVATSESSSSSVELFRRSMLAARFKNEQAGLTPAPVASNPANSNKRAPKRDPNTIHVGNLPYEATEDQIRELFEPYGSVTSIVMPIDRDTGNFRGFAFLTMSSRDEMLQACEAVNRSQYLGRMIFANESLKKEDQPKAAQATKLYVGNLSFDTTEDEVAGYFGQFGPVEEVYIPRDKVSGRPRGFCFVKMDAADSDKAIEGANGQHLKGRAINVNLSLPKGQRGPGPQREKKECTKLYVGNLNFATTADDLLSIFQEFGEVLDCYMPLDRETGSSRGFAFVTLEPDAAMRAADKMNGYELEDRLLRVNEAQR